MVVVTRVPWMRLLILRMALEAIRRKKAEDGAESLGGEELDTLDLENCAVVVYVFTFGSFDVYCKRYNVLYTTYECKGLCGVESQA